MVTWGVTDTGGDREVPGGPAGETGKQGLAAILRQLAERCEGDTGAIPRELTGTFSGLASHLTIPGSEPVVTALDCDAQYTLSAAAELPEGRYLLSVTVPTASDSDDPFTTERARLHIKFDGSASLQHSDGDIVLSLWDRQRIEVGIGETKSVGPDRIRVRETVEGLATGLSYLSAAHHTHTPSRSHPSQRRHPPLLTTGETESIPDGIRTVETGIELRVPACTESLFVAAPLAYYLGADVTTEARSRALLTADGADVHHEFGPLPEFQDEVADMLQRVFYLDCLVRRMDPESDPELLETCSLDPATVRTMTPAGQLDRYLEAPADAVSAATPEWHLSTHTQPSIEKARCLPFLLDKLSLIYLSDGSELERGDLLDRTLSDSYLTRGATASASIVEPNVGVGHMQGWLAPGTPIDAFKTTPAAYENRFRYGSQESDHLQLSVVLNETEMSEEHGAVSEIYRAADLPMVVSVRERLTTDELADVFESEHDLVHFIGHCEDDGLCCSDGQLSMDSLSESRTRTFFLNACGSYDQGLSLIEQGSVAGAVTFTDVLDSHAAMVGTAFARLLSNGFTIQRALQLARRRIMMGKDYAVVGDGTYALLPGPDDPVVGRIAETADGYTLTCEVITPQGAGESYTLPVAGKRILNGTETEISLGAETLVETLATHSMPVIYDGEFHWSGDLAARLDAGL